MDAWGILFRWAPPTPKEELHLYRSHPGLRTAPLRLAVALPALLLAGALPTWAASLSDGAVTPDKGTPATDFAYSVTYTGDVRPIAGYVVIDQKLALRMRRANDADVDPSAGIVYRRTTRLKREGVHKFRFVFLVPGVGDAAAAGEGGPGDRPECHRVFLPGPTGAETIRGPEVIYPDTFFIAGRVKAGPERPVEGIVITAKASGQPDATATTNEEGKYRIGDLPKGEYVVTAEAPTGTWTLIPGEIKVRVPPSRRGVDFLAAPPNLIAGKVRNINGRPLPGATVTTAKIVAEVEGAPVETKTDEHGNYAFTTLEAGVYVVRVAKPGYHFHPRARVVNVPPPRLRVNFDAIPIPRGKLTDGSVDPNAGTGATLFTYSVTYTHPDGIAPQRVWVVIDDGRPLAMQPVADTDVAQGVVFTYEAEGLDPGEHEFSFRAAYKRGGRTIWIHCPGPKPEDTLPGPTVHSE